MNTMHNINIIESTKEFNKAIINTKNYYFEFIFPKDVHEWFVTMYDNITKEKVWDDWSEWYISGNVTKDNIDDFYKEDIKYFISRVEASNNFKIIKELKLQGEIDNTWTTINVGEIKN